MKTTLLLMALTAVATSFSQLQTRPDFFGENLQLRTAGTTALVSLKDSSYWHSSWAKATGTWDFIRRNIYSYNSFYKENGNVSSNNSNGSGWVYDENAKNYVYDSNHRLREVTFENWNNGWSDYYKHSYTYDPAGNLLTQTDQVWLGGAWRNTYHSAFTYSGNNRTSALYRYWDSAINNWVNSLRTTFVYTGNQLTSSTDEDWNATSWTNSMRRTNFVYAGTDMLSYHFEMWDPGRGAFELKTKTSFTYDGNHHMLASSLETWDATGSVWEKSMKTDYSYDAHWNETQIEEYIWDASIGNWENNTLIINYYTTGTVGITERSDTKHTLALSPNPCTDEITLSASGHEITTVRIMDLSGKIVWTGDFKQNSPFSINVQSLEPGMYFVETKHEQGLSTGKFIKN